MQVNKGVEKEIQLVEKMNNLKLKDIPYGLQLLIKFMFPNVKDNDLVHSELMGDYVKPDFSITIKGRTRTVSLKTGTNNIIHQESIMEFCKFLQSRGISDSTLKTIFYYHYGDGTYDGTGEKRMSYAMIRAKLDKAFKSANEELNKDRRLVVDCMHRFLIKGKSKDNPEADYIYHGDEENGFMAYKDQILRYAETSKYDFLENLHIGAILFRPHARYFNKEIKSPKRRNTVEFYWPNMIADLIYIKKHYINRDE